MGLRTAIVRLYYLTARQSLHTVVLVVVMILSMLATSPVNALDLEQEVQDEPIADHDTNQSVEVLAASNDGYFLPNEAIQILIPNKVSSGWVIELDAIDITEMITLENQVATYVPVQPLTAGEHVLSIYEYLADGQIIDHGTWLLEVKLPEANDDYAITADTQVTVNYRLAEKNIGNPAPDAYQSEAYSQIAFSKTKDQWTAEGAFDLYYTSLEANRPSERTIENGEFYFTIGNPYFKANIGHQTVASGSLVMDGFHRRGISLEGRLPTLNTQVKGFSLSSVNVTGFGNGLGISNSNQRLEGYSVKSSLFADDPDTFSLSATWLSGSGDDAGSLIYNVDDFSVIANKGNARSITAESLLLENRLRLKAEFASSEYDYDPLDSFPADKDNAHDVLVTYSDITESGTSWNIGLNQRQIGTFFRSLANQSLPSDRAVQTVFGGAQWSTIGVQLNIEEQKDNIERFDYLPQITSDLHSLNLNWSPTVETTDNWYGTPNFSAGFSNQRLEQTYTPDDFLFAATDNEVDAYQLSSTFSYPKSSWGVSLINTEFVDRSFQQNDSDTMSIELFSDFLIGEKFNVSPSIRIDRTEDLVLNISASSVIYSLQSVFVFEPEKLDGSLSVVYSDNESSDLFTDDENMFINFALNWHIRPAGRNSFGVDLVIGGMYNDFKDRSNVFNSLETNQAFITLTLLLPNRAGAAQ